MQHSRGQVCHITGPGPGLVRILGGLEVTVVGNLPGIVRLLPATGGATRASSG